MVIDMMRPLGQDFVDIHVEKYGKVPKYYPTGFRMERGVAVAFYWAPTFGHPNLDDVCSKHRPVVSI